MTIRHSSTSHLMLPTSSMHPEIARTRRLERKRQTDTCFMKKCFILSFGLQWVQQRISMLILDILPEFCRSRCWVSLIAPVKGFISCWKVYTVIWKYSEKNINSEVCMLYCLMQGKYQNLSQIQKHTDISSSLKCIGMCGLGLEETF